jgi:hypothetical protein
MSDLRLAAHRTPGHEAGLRSDLNVARISETKIAGCSQAAKWVAALRGWRYAAIRSGA